LLPELHRGPEHTPTCSRSKRRLTDDVLRLVAVVFEPSALDVNGKGGRAKHAKAAKAQEKSDHDMFALFAAFARHFKICQSQNLL
jgi:hypothetical protein